MKLFVTAGDDEDAVATAEAAFADKGLLVGVDITPPGIEIDEDERINTLSLTSPSTSMFMTTRMKIRTPVSIRCRCW